MPKLNCWEEKKCGRQPGGEKVDEFGPCPASDYRDEGQDLNSGMNGGRICWAISGSLCGGIRQGTFAQKQVNCIICDFFKLVREEEGENFKMLLPRQKV